MIRAGEKACGIELQKLNMTYIPAGDEFFKPMKISFKNMQRVLPFVRCLLIDMIITYIPL